MKNRIVCFIMSFLLLSLTPVQVFAASGDRPGKALEDVEVAELQNNTIALTAAASSGTYGGNLSWTYDGDKTLTISGTGAMPDNQRPWQDYKDSIYRVIIENGVTSIGYRAFWEYSNIEQVSIPNSVTTIGAYAFWHCYGLKTVIIPNSVKTIEGDAFFACRSLTTVTIPQSVTSIAGRAFADCESMISINVDKDNSVYTSIDGVLFTKDGKELLQYPMAKEGTSYIIPDGVQSINESAFAWTSLENVTIPTSVHTIGDSAFFSSSLNTINIPDSVITIGDSAFRYCRFLDSLTLPKSVTTIGSGAFGNCWGLDYISVSPENTSFLSVDGVLYNREMTELVQFPVGKNAKSYEIPDGVVKIDSWAFSTSEMQSVSIPVTVNTIEEYAFDFCDMLTDVYYAGTAEAWSAITFGHYGNEVFSTAQIHYGESAGTGQGAAIVESGYCGGEGDGTNLSWTINSAGLLTISGKGPMDDYTNNSGDYSPWHFYYSRHFELPRISTVIIENGVTSIGSNAFSDLNELDGITIPDSITSIGNSAFWSCRSLRAIELPNTILEIGDSAFLDCRSLSSVILPQNITCIGRSTFYECASLTSITIPNGITVIDQNAFSNCSNLTDVYYNGTPIQWSLTVDVLYGNDDLLNASIHDIDGYTFNISDSNFCGGEGCGTNLSWEIDANGVLTISGIGEMKSYDYYYGQYTPWHMLKDTIITVEISEGVTSIGNFAFIECANITRVILPDGLSEIGSSAFSGCSGLTNVTIPDSVTSIGYSAFSGCSSLTNMTIPNNVTIIEGSLYSGCSSLTSITIPNSVTSIEMYAFDGCSSLTSITIPDSVTSIGIHAFQNCSGLTSVTIPETVTSIEHSVFYGCSGLTNVMIPDSVISIGYDAFRGCSSLTNMTIPGRVTSIESGVFSGCSGLTSVTIPDCVTSIGYGAFSDCSSLTRITIPDSVTSIDWYAFSGCSSLTSITIPDSVTSIESGAFSGCGSLVDVIIGDGVSSLRCFDFKYNDNLQFVSIGKGVTIIEDEAFWLCSGLKIITIPDSVTSIGNTAFSGCSSLTSLTIPDSVTSIGNNAFSRCSSLTSVSIPNSVTSIGDYAFDGCSSLTGVSIPDSVTSIGDYAFYGCSSLTGVSIPDSVISIGSGAFWRCDSLHDVYFSGSEEQYDAISGNGKPSKSIVHFEAAMPTPKTLKFDEPSYTLTVGGTINISAVYTGDEAPSISVVRWQSSDSAVYPMGGTSCLNLSIEDTNTQWVLSRPITVSKAGTYTVTIYADELSASTQIVAVDAGDGIRDELASGGEITFMPCYPGNRASVTEGSSFTLTALIPGGARLTGSNDVQWFKSLNGVESSLNDTVTTGESGETYSAVTVTVPSAGNTVRLRLVLSDGRSASYEISSKAKPTAAVTTIQQSARPLYTVRIPTAARQFTMLPDKQEELIMYAEGRDTGKLTGDERKKITSIVWTSSNANVIAFDQNGTNSLTHDGAKTWGIFHHETDETDSVKIYSRLPGTAKIICTVTIDGKTYAGNLDITVPGYEAETLDKQMKQWVSAYEEYTKALEKAMEKAGKSGNNIATVDDIGKALQEADRAKEESQRIVGFVYGKDKDSALVKYVYQGVASYLSENIPESFGFGEIRVSGDLTTLATSIVKSAFKPYKPVKEDYDTGVSMRGTIMGTASYVEITYRGELVAHMISQPQAGINTVMEMLNGLAELDKNLVNQAYKEALKEVFTTDLSHAVLSGVKQQVKKSLDEYAGTFLRSGAGDAAQFLKDCLDYYDYMKKISSAASAGSSDPFQALAAMKKVKFDYTTTKIRDAAVEASAKKLNEASDGILDWLNKWSDGKPLPKAAIEVFNLVWSFQCPVSIAVYDSSGTQIGYVGEDDIWYDAEKIYIENYGDEKRIYSMGEPITFQTVGEDYGTLNCSFEEYEDGIPVRRVNYYDIPLSEGTEINVTSTGNSIAENSLTVTVDTAEVGASETINATDYEDSTVVIRCLLSNENGGEVLGSGSHVRGDAVTLQAFSEEGYLFTGWMGSNGNLLSTSPVYEFTARENMVLTALFSEDIQICDTDSAVVYGIESGNGTEGAFVSATVSPLEGSSLTIYCAFYDENGRMRDVLSQTVENDGESVVILVTEASDVATAKLFVLDSQLIPLCSSRDIAFD